MENGFFSHTLHPNQFLLPPLLLVPLYPPFPRSTHAPFFFRKEDTTAKKDKTRYNKRRQKPSYKQTGQGNPTGGKESQEWAKMVRDTPAP